MMKFLKCLAMVVLVATTVFATSCKKENGSAKPDGFGLQGSWSTAAGSTGGKNFSFSALPKMDYQFMEGTLTVSGTYTYNSATDKLTLQPNMPGAPAETYDVKWTNTKWNAFALVATGSTAKSKEATYTRLVQ